MRAKSTRERRVASGMSSREAYPPKNTILSTRSGALLARRAVARPAQEHAKSVAAPVVADDAMRPRELFEEAARCGIVPLLLEVCHPPAAEEEHRAVADGGVG